MIRNDIGKALPGLNLSSIHTDICGLDGISYSLWEINRSFTEILHYEELNLTSNLFYSVFKVLKLYTRCSFLVFSLLAIVSITLLL